LNNFLSAIKPEIKCKNLKRKKKKRKKICGKRTGKRATTTVTAMPELAIKISIGNF